MEHFTNGDKMLQAVLFDEKLAEFGEYSPGDYLTLDQALCSDNPVVCTVAKIISDSEDNFSDTEIYKEITNYLKANL